MKCKGTRIEISFEKHGVRIYLCALTPSVIDVQMKSMRVVDFEVIGVLA